MGFETEVIQRLDKIEAALSAMRTGRFAGQKPGGMYTPRPVDEADVEAVLERVGDLGEVFPGEAFVRGWLAKGYSVSEVVAAIEGVIAPFLGKGGELNPGNPRAGAAYLAAVAHDGGWAVQTLNRLQGKNPGPIVSPDPESNLLAGLSNVNGPADLDAIVPIVIERAERGIDWMGQVRLSAADLAHAKAVFDNKAAYRDEWKGWVDNRLLRILLCTNDIARDWNGVLGPYPIAANLPVLKVNEYLFEQWSRLQVGN